MVKLPEPFVMKMRDILGEEYPLFEQSYEQPRRYGLRVNTAKILPEEFEKIVPFHLQKISWIPGAYTYREEDNAARHPYYAAGLYYLQEPSAMTPASVLDARPGEKVLDLCAAPGGKATALGAAMKGRGLLVANDISASRVKALLHNIEIFGIGNVLVTNEVPAKMTACFSGFFDKVLVDAPCSGEGMFRKDESTIRAWYPEKSAECAAIQRDLVLRAADMLRPGGRMVYSTCTFAPEENEEVIRYLLEKRPDLKPVPIEKREGFSEGLNGMSECVRLWPHRTGGEGHFLALLEKDEEADLRGESGLLLSDREKTGTGGRRKKSRKQGRYKEPDHSPDQNQRQLLEEFFKPFGSQRNPMKDPEGHLQVYQNSVFFISDLVPPVSGITYVRSGLYLGELKKDRFEPGQALAMWTGRGEWGSSLCLPADDERLMRYLCGESIPLSDIEGGPDGWKIVCVDGYPLGWGKKTGTTLKNKYHPGWRMRQ